MKGALPFLSAAIVLLIFSGGLWGEDSRDEWAARQIYLENCGGCHGFDRMGFVGVSLSPADLGALSEAGIRSLVRYGIRDTLMPAWDCRLSLDERRLLAHYFKTTRPESRKEIRVKENGNLGVAEASAWWDDPRGIERGNFLFGEYCMGCHHPEYEAFAPAYRSVARQRDVRAIVGQIKFPYTSSKILGYTEQTMPKFDLTDEEIKNLGAYVYHFRALEK